MYLESFDSERCAVASGNIVICIIVGGSRNFYRIYALVFRRALRKYSDTYSVFGYKAVASYCHLVIGEVIGFCVVSLCCILYGERNRPCRNGKGFVLTLRNRIVGISVRGSRDNKRIYALISFFVRCADARRNCVGSYKAVHTVYGVTVEIVQFAVVNLGSVVDSEIYALGIDCQSLVGVFDNRIVGVVVQRRGDYERIASCVCRSRRRRHAESKFVHKVFGTRYAYSREVVNLSVIRLDDIFKREIYLSLGNLHSSRLSSRRTAVYEELVVFGRQLCRYGDFSRIYVASRILESNLLPVRIELRAFCKHVSRYFCSAVILHIGGHLNSTRNLRFIDRKVYGCAVGSIVGFAAAESSRNRINSRIDYPLGRNAEVISYIVVKRALRHIEQTCVIRKLSIVVSLALLCFRADTYRHRRNRILRANHAVRREYIVGNAVYRRQYGFCSKCTYVGIVTRILEYNSRAYLGVGFVARRNIEFCRLGGAVVDKTYAVRKRYTTLYLSCRYNSIGKKRSNDIIIRTAVGHRYVLNRQRNGRARILSVRHVSRNVPVLDSVGSLSALNAVY